MSVSSKASGHRKRVGYSIPAAAKELDYGESTFRRAVDRGEVKTVQFGGLRRVPPAEVERLREILGDGRKLGSTE